MRHSTHVAPLLAGWNPPQSLMSHLSAADCSHVRPLLCGVNSPPPNLLYLSHLPAIGYQTRGLVPYTHYTARGVYDICVIDVIDLISTT